MLAVHTPINSRKMANRLSNCNAFGRGLEALILAEGPETIGGFIAEPVQGAGGVIVPPPTYFEKIQPILKKYEILSLRTEVITDLIPQQESQ